MEAGADSRVAKWLRSILGILDLDWISKWREMYTPTSVIFQVLSPSFIVYLFLHSLMCVSFFSICLFIQFVTASSSLFLFLCGPDYTPPAAKSVASSLPWHWSHLPLLGLKTLIVRWSSPVRFLLYKKWAYALYRAMMTLKGSVLRKMQVQISHKL